jgi:sec-independent protein translocase protein TatA
MDVGPGELIVILMIVVILFGVGRVAQLGGELGRAIREFRSGLQDGSDSLEAPSAPGRSPSEAADRSGRSAAPGSRRPEASRNEAQDTAGQRRS